MRQIKFTRHGSSSVFGNFEPGDILRCSDDEARHFVDEASCAEYVTATAAAPPPPPVQTPAPETAAPAASATRKRATR